MSLKKKIFNIDKAHKELLDILESPYKSAFEAFSIQMSLRRFLKDINDKAYERGYMEAMEEFEKKDK